MTNPPYSTLQSLLVCRCIIVKFFSFSIFPLKLIIFPPSILNKLVFSLCYLRFLETELNTSSGTGPQSFIHLTSPEGYESDQ